MPDWYVSVLVVKRPARVGWDSGFRAHLMGWAFNVGVIMDEGLAVETYVQLRFVT